MQKRQGGGLATEGSMDAPLSVSAVLPPVSLSRVASPQQSVYIRCMVGGISRKRVNKRGLQTYFIYYDYKGNRYSVHSDFNGRTFTNEEEANDFLNMIRLEIKEHRHDPEKYRPENKNRYSASNVLAAYLESRSKDIQKGKLGQSQFKDIKRYLTDYLEAYLNEERIKDIREVRGYHLEKMFNNKLPKWAPKTIKNFRAVIYTFFSWCVEKAELLQKIPAIPEHPDIPEQVIRWLTQEQQETILSHIPEKYRPIFEFMARYGCRPREAMALQVGDVHFEISTIYIQRAFNRSDELAPTKTKRVRPLPIVEETEDLLREAVKGKIGAETPLFVNPNSGSYYTYQALRKQWDKAWARQEKECAEKNIAALERVSLTEGTRKSVATMAINSGEQESVISGMLGNSPEILKRHYAQLQAARYQGIVQRRGAKILEFGRFQSVSKRSK